MGRLMLAATFLMVAGCSKNATNIHDNIQISQADVVATYHRSMTPPSARKAQAVAAIYGHVDSALTADPQLRSFRSRILTLGEKNIHWVEGTAVLESTNENQNFLVQICMDEENYTFSATPAP